MQWFDPRMAGWYCKESVPQDERVEGGNGSIPEWRDDGKGSVPKDERVEGGNGSIPEWRDGTEKGRSL